MIPYFREIITLCVDVLREGTTGRHRRSALNIILIISTVVKDAQSILLGLLSSIPSFWSSAEVVQVITLSLDHCVSTSGSPSSLMSDLMKSVAKRAPTKVLIHAMIELWPSLGSSQQMV